MKNVSCKDCKKCEGIDFYIWYEKNGNKHREWMYFCEIDGFIDEETATTGECPNYEPYCNDDFTERA